MDNSPTQDLVEALSSVRRIVTADPRDWGADRHDAFIYGVFRGWSDSATESEIASRHAWDDAFLERLHRLNAAVSQALE